MPEEKERQDLAQRIIELSDLISEHSKLLARADFVPTPEFIEKTHRLTELCRELTREADAKHAQRQSR